MIPVALLLGGGGVLAIALTDDEDEPERAVIPGLPQVEVISPRDGSRHQQGAVVVKVKVSNFELAPTQFGKPPQLGQGHIKFALRRVPAGVDESAQEEAASDPLGAGRLVGPSFDYPRYSGPNGVLAEQVGTTGLYSPATGPEIFYRNLPDGFYRLIITLARNDGTSTRFYTVTHFEIEDSRAPEPTEELNEAAS